MWEPLEEGLVPLETTRHVSIITITLSKIELDMSSIGNQPPLPVNQVKVGSHNGRDGRRRPMSRGNVEYEDGGGDHNRGYGRGRGRGSRGRGRGGYNGQQADRMEDGGYNYEVPIHNYLGEGDILDAMGNFSHKKFFNRRILHFVLEIRSILSP
ncbi:hypothetical protein Gogos_017558, partial [Gossypium gossypioides]|nr:hypothetical protein [Gossypium gossypioides]